MNFAGVKSITIPEGDVRSIAIGGVTVWQKPNPLPYDAEVEYVQSDGTNWVETDYVPTSGAFAVDMTALEPVNGFMMFFGAYISNSNRFYATNNSGSNVQISWQFGTARPGSTFFPDVKKTKTSYVFSDNTHPFYVFYMSNNPSLSFHPAYARFASAQFWDADNNLALDLISVRVGTAGYLYDRANPTGGPSGNGLYGSATSTALVAGPDKIPA